MGVNKSILSFHEAKTKYRDIFDLYFKETENDFLLQGLTLQITRIDMLAMKAYGGFSMDWKGIFKKQSSGSALAKSLSIAIWDGGILVGLALGKVSKARNLVSFSHIESNGNYSGPLSNKVVPIVTLAGVKIGNHVGASHIALLDPVNAKVESYYSRLGYKKSFLYGVKKSMFLDIREL